MAAAGVKPAPYAMVAIPLFLGSTTGMRYRTLSCMECGRDFLERQGDVMYRIGDHSQPDEIAIADNVSLPAVCGNCSQSYQVSVSVSVMYEQGNLPLYMQPQSVYLHIEPVKSLRYVHCLECGRPFNSISDRISQMVDNRIPFEYVNAAHIGPIEAMCQSAKCGQYWSLIV